MKTDKIQNTAITSFRGEYAFLSNFFEALIEYNGLRFRNNEAAFQAMKNPREAYRYSPADSVCHLSDRVKAIIPKG